MKLTRSQIKSISRALDDLFYGVKAKMLGRFFTGPKIYFEVVDNTDPQDTLEGIFRWVMALGHPTAEVDDEQIKQLAHITGNYITAEHLKIKNRVFAGIRQADSPAQVQKLVNASLEEATKYVDMLIQNEVRTVQAYAEKEGISQVSASLGDENPTVVFLGVCDDKLCKYCRKMYHDASNIRKPVPYKMSELQEGYFKAKLWDGETAHMAPLHPHCRHVMSYVPPNFGFDASGTIVFRSLGYDYYKDYHGLKKSEKLPPEPDFSGYQEYIKEET